MSTATLLPTSVTDNQGWLLQGFERGDIFFASSQHQLRASPSPQDLHAYAPISAALVDALFHAAAQQGHAQPVLFGAIPFDVTQAASLTLATQVRQDAVPSVWEAPATAQASPAVIKKTPVPAPEVYGKAVESALELFEQGAVKKIVLARSMDVELAGPIDAHAVLRDLLARNRHGYTFSIPIGPVPEAGAVRTASMMGASPELLVRRVGDQVFINPLAGSIPRHADPAQDEERRQGLAVSEKDLREHGYVVSDIARILEQHCTDLEIPAGPSVIGTDALWHLSTFITARLKSPSMSALDLGLALHPTPAMCGFPTAAAFSHIQTLEPFEREYFAGLIGWQHANGDGEWALTIRCGRYDGDKQFRLYAGAGTVAGSDPASEIRETETKMATFLRAIAK